MRKVTLILTLALLLLPALALAAEAAEITAAGILPVSEVPFPQTSADIRGKGAAERYEVPYAAPLAFLVVVEGLGPDAGTAPVKTVVIRNLTTQRVIRSYTSLLMPIPGIPYQLTYDEKGRWTGSYCPALDGLDRSLGTATPPLFSRGENRIRVEFSAGGERAEREFVVVVGQREVVPRVRITAFARGNGLIEGRVEASHAALGVNPERALAAEHECDLYLDGQKVRTLILRQDPDRPNTAYATFMLRAARGIHTLRAVVR